jgi:hypothetical protein
MVQQAQGAVNAAGGQAKQAPQRAVRNPALGIPFAGAGGRDVPFQALVHAPLVSDRQILALEIFQGGQDERLILRQLIANDRGHKLQTGQDRGAPAAFPGDDDVGFAIGPDHNGLHNAVLADRLGQFVQGHFIKVLASLLRVLRIS